METINDIPKCKFCKQKNTKTIGYRKQHNSNNIESFFYCNSKKCINKVKNILITNDNN